MRPDNVKFVTMFFIVLMYLSSSLVSANILRPVVQQPPLGKIEGIVNHPGGKLVVTWDNHQIITFWNPRSGQMVKSWKGALRDINNIAFSPDGKHLVLFDSIVGKLFIWNVDKQQLVSSDRLDFLDVKDEALQAKKRLAGKSFAERSIMDMMKAEFSTMWLDVTFDKEGKILFVKEPKGISQGRVAIIDFKEALDYSPGYFNRVVDAKCHRGVVINPLAKTFFCSNRSIVSEWDIKTGRLIRQFKDHPEDVEKIAITNDYRNLVVSTENRSVTVWDLKTGEPATTVYLKSEDGFTDRGYVSAAVVSPDKSTIVSCGEDYVLRAWDFKSGKFKYKTKCNNYYRKQLKITPDSNYIVHIVPRRWKNTNKSINYIEILHIDTGKSVYSFEIQPELIKQLEIDKSGRYILIGGQKFQIWDMAQKREVKMPDKSPLALIDMVYDDGEDRIIASYDDSSIKIWDAVKGNLQKTLEPTSSNVSALDYNSDKSILAAGTEKGEIILWSKHLWWKKYQIKGHDHKITSIKISPRHNLLISASSDEFIKLWHLDSGKLIKKLWAHEYVVKDDKKEGRFAETGVLSMELQPQEEFLVSGGYDGKVKIWRLPDGELLKILDYTYTNRNYSTFDVAISPDGKKIAAIGENSRLRAWMVEFEAHYGKIKTPSEMIVSGFFSSNFDPLYGNQIYFHPLTQELIAVYNSQAVVIFDLLSGEYGLPHRFSSHTADTLLFPKHGKTIITGGKYSGILLNDYPDFTHSASIYAFKDSNFSINYQDKIRGKKSIQHHLSFANQVGVCPFSTCFQRFKTEEPLLSGQKLKNKESGLSKYYLLGNDLCPLPDVEFKYQNKQKEQRSALKILYDEMDISQLLSIVKKCNSTSSKIADQLKSVLLKIEQHLLLIKQQEAVVLNEAKLRNEKENVISELRELAGSYKQNQLVLTLTRSDLDVAKEDIINWEQAILNTKINQDHSKELESKKSILNSELFDKNILDSHAANISKIHTLFSKRFFFNGQSQLLTLRRLEKRFKPYVKDVRRDYSQDDLQANFHNPYPVERIDDYIENIEAFILDGEHYLILNGKFGDSFKIEGPKKYFFTTSKGVRNFVLPLLNIRVGENFQTGKTYHYKNPFLLKNARIFNNGKEGDVTKQTQFILFKPRKNLVPVIYPLPDRKTILIHLKTKADEPIDDASIANAFPYFYPSTFRASLKIGDNVTSPFVMIRSDKKYMGNPDHGIYFNEKGFEDLDKQDVEIKRISNSKFSFIPKINKLSLNKYKKVQLAFTKNFQWIDLEYVKQKVRSYKSYRKLIVKAKKDVFPRLVLPISPKALCIALDENYDRKMLPPDCIRPETEYEQLSTGNKYVRQSFNVNLLEEAFSWNSPEIKDLADKEAIANLKIEINKIIKEWQPIFKKQNTQERVNLQKLNKKIELKLFKLAEIEKDSQKLNLDINKSKETLAKLFPPMTEQACDSDLSASDCLNLTRKIIQQKRHENILALAKYQYANYKYEVVSLKSFSDKEITRQINRFKSNIEKQLEKTRLSFSTAHEKRDEHTIQYQLKHLPDKIHTYPFQQASDKKLLMILSGKVLVTQKESPHHPQN